MKFVEVRVGSTTIENMLMKIFFPYKLGDVLSTCMTFTFTLRFTLFLFLLYFQN